MLRQGPSRNEVGARQVHRDLPARATLLSMQPPVSERTLIMVVTIIYLTAFLHDVFEGLVNDCLLDLCLSCSWRCSLWASLNTERSLARNQMSSTLGEKVLQAAS